MSERRLTTLETAVFGWPPTGEGGLIHARAKDKQRLESIEQSFLQARTIVRASRWLLLAMAALLTATNANGIAGTLAATLKAAASLAKG